jgi:hypothetical protein
MAELLRSPAGGKVLIGRLAAEGRRQQTATNSLVGLPYRRVVG